MTIEQAKHKLVAWATAQIGTREGPNNQNPYAPYLTKLYGWNAQNQPWCDVFVDAGFIVCFGYDAGSAMTYQYTGMGSALCSASASFYQQHGAWYDRPEVGDQAFFNVSGGINHTGIVTEVSGSTFTTVEGNSSDMVARRTYDVDSPRVAGFGRPRWSVAEKLTEAKQEKPAEEPVKAPAIRYHPYTYSVKINLLKKGDRGPQVASMKAMLNAKGFPCAAGDIFDAETENALMTFQQAAGIEADGEYGGASFAALLNWG